MKMKRKKTKLEIRKSKFGVTGLPIGAGRGAEREIASQSETREWRVTSEGGCSSEMGMASQSETGGVSWQPQVDLWRK